MRKKNKSISPEEALQFLHSFQQLMEDVDGPKEAISIRIPKNILNNLKTIAKRDGKKYQSLIVEILRNHLKQ